MSNQSATGVESSDRRPDARPAAAVALERRNARKAVVAASIGNGLEWFDLIVYGTFAVTISKLFFPTTSEAASLLLTFASFGVSFITRPLGGIIIGRYADRAGRKADMLVSILVMFVGTLLIVVAPTAAAIGVTASILVLVARLLQGFATGGESGTATSYLIEYAPTRKALRQLAGSHPRRRHPAGRDLRIRPEHLPQHPVSRVVGLAASVHLRSRYRTCGLVHPVQYGGGTGIPGRERSASPLKETFIGNDGRRWAIVGVVSLGSVGVYIALFMPTYVIVNLGMPKTVAFLSTLIFGVVMSVGSPFVGMLADKVGPARVMSWAGAGTIIIGIPAFLVLIAAPVLPTMIVVELVLSVLATAYFAPLPAIMSSMFPARPVNGAVPGLRHRGGGLRRIRSVYPHVADRQHRLPAGTGLLPGRHRRYRRGEPGYLAQDVPPSVRDRRALGFPLEGREPRALKCDVERAQTCERPL